MISGYHHNPSSCRRKGNLMTAFVLCHLHRKNWGFAKKLIACSV